MTTPPNKFLATAKSTNKTTHNSKYLQLSFELAQPFTKPFLAGQYVSLKIGEQGELRSYSICSSPAVQNSFDLLIDVTPQGIGTTFLKNLGLGGEVEVLGPLGRFTLKEDQLSRPAVFIGTGSGVAPLRSMLLQLLQVDHSTQPVELIWGERYANDLIWLDELLALEQSFSNFKFTPVISKPTATDTQFAQGRVTNLIESRQLPANAIYYLCGNKAMITDMDNLLKSKGVAPEAICFEKFY